jgi:hypothetical protein
MNRMVVTLASALAVGVVAVPVALSEDGRTEKQDGTQKQAVTCARSSFAGRITRVGTDGVAVRPGDSELGRPLVVRLTNGTVVKQSDVVVGASALAAGQRARFLVRACRSGDRKALTALAVLILKNVETSQGTGAETREPRKESQPTTTPQPVPRQAQDTCGQGEMNTVLVAVSPTSVTVRTTSAEGIKEWPLAITADTVVRMNDQNVPISTLRVGDLVHVVLVRCTSGSVRALRIVVLQVSAQA